MRVRRCRRADSAVRRTRNAGSLRPVQEIHRRWLRWEYPRSLPTQARRCTAWSGSLRLGRSAVDRRLAPQHAGALRGPRRSRDRSSQPSDAVSLQIGRTRRQHAGADESEHMPMAWRMAVGGWAWDSVRCRPANPAAAQFPGRHHPLTNDCISAPQPSRPRESLAAPSRRRSDWSIAAGGLWTLQRTEYWQNLFRCPRAA